MPEDFCKGFILPRPFNIIEAIGNARPVPRKMPLGPDDIRKIIREELDENQRRGNSQGKESEIAMLSVVNSVGGEMSPLKNQKGDRLFMTAKEIYMDLNHRLLNNKKISYRTFQNRLKELMAQQLVTGKNGKYTYHSSRTDRILSLISRKK
jgi:hypothetical protein